MIDLGKRVGVSIVQGLSLDRLIDDTLAIPRNKLPQQFVTPHTQVWEMETMLLGSITKGE